MGNVEASYMLKAEKRLRRKLTVENLWMFIIAILAEKPSYAYGVRIMLRRVFDIKVPSVTVYTVLYRMVREGLLKTERVNGVKVYKPTKQGIEAFTRAKKFLKDIVEKLENVKEEQYSTKMS